MSSKKIKLREVQAMNMDTVPYNTIMKMKPGSTIKMKDGKIRTKDKFGNWRANTDRNDIIGNRDIVKHMKGMKGYNMGGGRIRIEGKLNERVDYKYLTQVILDANPKHNVYYNSSRNVVNIGGVGYDKGDLVKNFNQKPGSSGKIKNNFYYANQDPDNTKREIEKLSRGKIKVDIQKGYGGKPVVVYIVKEGKMTEALKKGDVVKFKNGKSLIILGPKGDGYDYQERGRRSRGHHPKGWFDMMIRTGKAVVEGKMTEAFKKGDKVKYNDMPGVITHVHDTFGKTYYSVKYKSPSGTRKARMILSTDGSITEASAKDKFNAPPMNKWWTGDKDALMSAIYHAQRQLPPSNKKAYNDQWKSIVQQLQKKYPAPANIYKKKLKEAEMNEGLNKKDVSYQLSVDYSGRTKPKVVKLNNKELTVFYGYKVNPADVIKSIEKLDPSIKLKHKAWNDRSSGGGTHTFIIESKINEDFSQRKRNFTAELRKKMELAKNGTTMKIGKLSWTKVKNNWKGGKYNRTEPHQLLIPDIVDDMYIDIKNSRNYDASDVISKIKFEGKETMKLSKLVKEAAPGYMHDCASKVIHMEHGAGTCIPEQHNLVKEGNKWIVTEYDVKFDSGKVVRNIPVSELKIVTESHHGHKRRKKKTENVKVVKGNPVGSSLAYRMSEPEHKQALKWLQKTAKSDRQAQEVLDTLDQKYSADLIISVNGRLLSLYGNYGMLRFGAGGKLGSSGMSDSDYKKVIKMMR